MVFAANTLGPQGVLEVEWRDGSKSTRIERPKLNSIYRVEKQEAVKRVRLTEEHGICEVQGPCDIKLGDNIQLITGHCCTTTNLHEMLYAHRKGKIEAVWPIAARGR